MITFLVAFLTSLLVGAVLTAGVRNLAVARGWLDQANTSRKIHARPIPRLGGVAIVGGFFAPLTALLIINRSGVGLLFQAQEELALGLFVGGLAIAALGLYDDLRGTGARLKFLVQFSVAAGLYALGFRIEILANPFGEPFALGYFALPFTLLWMVGIVNAMNLIDGLDGLAGGVAFFSVATNFILAFARGDVLLCLLMAALAGALLGFLIFNFNPASIFMGDTGSMFLGFVLAAVSIKTSTKSGTAVALLVPIISLGLPIMDTLLAMLRRSLLGLPVFSADKEHIHHRVMSRLFLNQRRAVLVLYALCCVFMLTALGLNYANSAQSALLLLAVGAVVVVLMRKLGYLNLRGASSMGQTRRRNLELRSIIHGANERLAAARDLQGVWDAARPLAEALGARELVLSIRKSRDGQQDAITFETSRPAGAGPRMDFAVELKAGEDALGQLALSWSDGRLEVSRDEELALEVVADAMAKTILRVLARESASPAKVVALRK